MTQMRTALMDHLLQGWQTCRAQRSLMLGAALLLAVFVTLFRGWVLSGDIPEGGPIWCLLWLLAATHEDYLVVGLLLAAGVIVGPVLPNGTARRIWGWIWVTLALGLLVLGFTNIFAVQILGGPVIRDWIVYSDIGNTDVILDSVFFIATSSRISTLVAITIVFLLGAYGLRANFVATQNWLVLPVVWIALLGLPILMPTVAMGVGGGKLANPLLALVGSYLGASDTPLLGLSDAARRQDPPDLGIADPITRPEVASGTIRNVVVIAIDAVSTRYVQGFEGTYPNTPNILRYQSEGMRFVNAYAHVPASNFFLVTLLAGIVPELSRESMTFEQSALDLHTLSQAVSAQGYRTGFFNSSDNRFQNTEAFVKDAGFDLVQDYRNWTCEQGVYETKEFAQQFLNTSNDHCTINALTNWIGSDPGSPFFAVMRTGMSHYPYYPGDDPQRFVEDTNRNNYINAIRVSDAAFGQLMAFLEEEGLAESTLVIVLGDHGEAFGEHGTAGHASGIYEENVHVPLLFVNPVAFSGEQIKQIVGLSELAPTIADLLGMPPSPYWQARSVFAHGRADGVFFFSPWNGFPIGFRQGSRKFIYSANTEQSSLYDLEQDPGETVDLSLQDPDADAEARQLVAEWISYHTGWIERAVRERSALAGTSAVPEGPGQLVLYASGTSYLSPPQADIYLDGAYLGRATVTRAPSNAENAVPVEQVAAAVSTFRFDVPEIRCSSQIEIRFVNDEWEGEGQTGDTDFYVAGLEFAGRSYAPGELHALAERVGGLRQGYFTFWRNGAAKLDVFLPAACVSEQLADTNVVSTE
ncbi:sulfatase-like hydrolase/transferase [Sulfitobacter sp. HGT1]|jgi:lipoteichoic acid synthase|uniref:sulfatase-like hydrolase/transferase n=2 Tax=Sulfitobacter TaxID=60136 RepID=UPI001593A5BE|nr:sulfatase-like hydrolase/transferase [Sulfitobacter sp. HGT1]